MRERREFLKMAGVFLVTAACNPDKLFGPPKKPKFAAWTASPSDAPFPLQRMSIDPRQDRQYTQIVASPGDLSFAESHSGQLYIHGDEPDQQGILPADYAVLYNDWTETLKARDPKARFSPAGFAEPNQNAPGPHSTDYADQFYGAYKTIYGKAPQVDEWRFHDFALGFQGNVGAWWERVEKSVAWSESHDAPMVLGSWGFIDWPIEDFTSHMREAMSLIKASRINQAVWWSREDLGSRHFLSNTDGSLTAEGQVYAEAAA